MSASHEGRDIGRHGRIERAHKRVAVDGMHHGRADRREPLRQFDQLAVAGPAVVVATRGGDPDLFVIMGHQATMRARCTIANRAISRSAS